MLLGIASIALALGQVVPLAEFREGHVRTRVTEGGRIPLPRDLVANEVVQTGDIGLSESWRPAKANAEGWFEGIGGGYVYCTYDSPQDQVVLLDAVGHSLVYVDGIPRGGDPYGYGYLRLPIKLNQGRHTFVFGGGRGRVRAKLSPTRAPLQMELADATLPDVVARERKRLIGAIVVLNNSEQPSTGIEIRAGNVVTKVPPIPPLSLRIVPFNFEPLTTTGKLELDLYRNKERLDSGSVEIRVRQANEHYKRTFVSGIDGSVQYYGVAPSLKPSKSNGLVLTLHGASVEGIGQAAAYAPKDWAWIVAPTNRRPYGFDWEDWGRMDALEVFEEAKRTLPHNPSRTYLTGHSMGGHGTWAVGTMFPDKFAAIAPSAGWVSFWTYAGGWNPREPSAPERLLRSSMNIYDTLMRQKNLERLGVYVLHGDADDNVPVGQARMMRQQLQPWHKKFLYHEQPGAGHWWGNECVDWPGIFNLFRESSLSAPQEDFEFVTPSPAISSRYRNVEILQSIDPTKPSRVVKKGFSFTTENVRRLRLGTGPHALQLDGQTFSNPKAASEYVKSSIWTIKPSASNEKVPGQAGPIKEAMQNRMVLVYGTAGTPEKNAWAYAKARFDAENWYYRGNGAVDVLPDTSPASELSRRNLVLYGNADTNRIWKSELAASPIQVRSVETKVGERQVPTDAGVAFTYPRPGGGMAVAFGGSTLKGMRLCDRLPVFTSGVGYPDWIVLQPNAYELGTKGVLGAGFFGNDWRLTSDTSAWLPTP